MTKISLSFILILLIACKSNSEKHAEIQARDSIMVKYFQVVDSLPYSDTLDGKFKLLKAYHTNDTSYLKTSYKETEDLLKYREEMLTLPLCEQFPLLNKLNFEETYRFSYEAAFCNKSTTVTIGKKSDTITLDTYLYEFNDKQTDCKTISHTTKQLSERDWTDFLNGIDYADFWGLKEDNGRHGLDGSSLQVIGYERPKNAFQGRYKKVYRWAAERTAIGELFKKLLYKSGINVSCFPY